MNDLDDAFARLLARQPTDAERQRLYQVRDALDLKNNDALWLVLIALQHYDNMYSRFPELIKQAAAQTLLEFQRTATSTLDATKAVAEADLAKAVAATARDVARLTVVKQAAIWIATCLAVCVMAFSAFGWSVHNRAFKSGYDKGYAAAYVEAKDEKAAASWANTPQGKSAYRLAQYGAIDSLTECNLPGWKIQAEVCYVRPANDGFVYGWRVR
ncbi:DUF6753 family protein [Duganella sp. FT27W]|uniref:DUF6753 family protein n=1 Tax=Duganella sp. FT27W TaxID=2654636 RepID=UPI00128D789B|nr:DUF6753 family protein [Duganella sp. FT27W]MPQ58844.1 protein mobE [Duganella sp. FT27W]